MGSFKINCKVENISNRKKSALTSQMLVDTGSEYTWVPSRILEKLDVTREKKDVSFVMANGQVVTRSIGFALLCYDTYFTVGEVVFAEPLLPGARTLEGLNLTVDARQKKLVAAGPILAA